MRNILLSASLVLPFFATAKPAEENLSCCTSCKSLQIELRHTEPRGIGFYEGYSSLEAFFIPCKPTFSFYPYVDFRSHIFNDGRLAFNGGLGLRSRVGNRIYGGNLFYDFRSSPLKNFNQIGAGFETIGLSWDFYANGYAVVGAHKSRPATAHFHDFQNHEMRIKQTVRSALSGFDLGARYHFFIKKNWDLYLDLKPYYFTGAHAKNIVGGQAALSGRLYEYFFVSANTSYDRKFKWLGQGTFGVTLPFGGKQCTATQKGTCTSELVFRDRITQFPSREEIIPVVKHKKISTAINPATGLPYHFVFVDGASAAPTADALSSPSIAADGTIGSPFTTLLAAQNGSEPGDVLYVFPATYTPGVGAKRGNGGSQVLTLSDGQKIFGSATEQQLLTTQGLINIPALSSQMPTIFNTLGNGIVLANHNVISGFAFDSVDIGVTGTGKANATIINNVFTQNNSSASTTLYGIFIQGPGLSGTYFVGSNTFTGTSSASNAIVDSIFISPGIPGTRDTCSVVISNNAITTHGAGYTLSTENNMTSGQGIVDVSVLYNSISCASKSGVELNPHNNSILTYSVAYNRISSSTGKAGLHITGADQSTLSGSVLSNVFFNSSRGFEFENGSNGPDELSESVVATDNLFYGNTTYDFYAHSSKLNQLCISLQGNDARNLGYTFENDQVSSHINLTSFLGNIGSLVIIGPVTQNATCP